MEKSIDAFRTISEVAVDLDLPQHVLRFWETRFTQIKPLKRGGGRRYYRPEDVDLLAAVRRLLYEEGYTIKGVQKILKEQGVRAVAAMPPRDATALQTEAAASDESQDGAARSTPVEKLQSALREIESATRTLAVARRPLRATGG